MKYEVVEDPNAWIVRRDGEEVGRFGDQDLALAEAARRMADRTGGERSHSFSVRYLERSDEVPSAGH